MSDEISNERLEEIVGSAVTRVFPCEQRQMAKELLALRMAFSVPDYWEIAGLIFATEEEAFSYGYRGRLNPLYSKPEA